MSTFYKKSKNLSTFYFPSFKITFPQLSRLLIFIYIDLVCVRVVETRMSLHTCWWQRTTYRSLTFFLLYVFQGSGQVLCKGLYPLRYLYSNILLSMHSLVHRCYQYFVLNIHQVSFINCSPWFLCYQCSVHKAFPCVCDSRLFPLSLLSPSIHLEQSFVQGNKYGSNSILLDAVIHFGQYNLLKMLSFFHCVFLASL